MPAPRTDSQPGRILLIEDNSISRNILSNLLRGEGYEVLEEEDGARGLERVIAERPDLVCLDVILPRMSGFEVCRAIRRHPDVCTTPVLIVTALDRKDDVIKGLKAGATDYLAKPFSPVEILARIRVNLDTRLAVQGLRESTLKVKLASEVLEATTSSLDLRQVLFLVVTKTAETLGAKRCSIILVEGSWGEGGRTAQGRVLVSQDDPNLPELTIDLQRYPEILEAFSSGQLVAVSDVASDPLMERVREHILPLGVDSIVAAPLTFRGEVMGALLLRCVRRGRSFDAEEMATVRVIAGASSNAIKNATLYRILENRTEKLERINEELRRSNEELTKVNRVKSDFVSMVSHELRTPLTSVIGFSDLLAEGHAGELNPEQKEYVRQVLRKSKDLLALINDLLDTGQLESGRMALRLRTVWLHELVQSVLSSTQHLTGVPPDFRVTLPADLPPLEADGEKLSQVLINLVANALKFSPPGAPVEIGARLLKGRRETDRGDLVQFSVRDHGVGISEDLQQRIFEQFFQIDQGATRSFKGAGLGLFICRSLVELHGGKIWVESAVGSGSTFHFTVPVSQN